jgi:hypothetical protein
MLKKLIILGITLTSINCWAADPSIDCLANIANDPTYAKLGSKIVMTPGGQPTIAMLADQTKVSKTDKPLLSKAADEADTCFSLGVNYRRQTFGVTISTLIEQSIYAFKDLAAQLYTGQITYGEFNKRRWASDQYYNQQIIAVNQQAENERTQVAAQQAQEDQAKAAREAEIEAWRAQQDANWQAQQEAEQEAEREQRREASIQMMQSGFSMMCASMHTRC